MMSEQSRELLRRVVPFAFKETATSADVEAIEVAVAALPPRIAALMVWG